MFTHGAPKSSRNSFKGDHVFQVELEFRNVGFVEGGKPENPEENPQIKDENQKQTQPTYDVEFGNRTRAALVRGECSNHCAIPALPWVGLVEMVSGVLYRLGNYLLSTF